MWRAMDVERPWTRAEHLQAVTVDVLQLANWQRAGDADADLPEPVERPGVVNPKAEKRRRNDERARAFRDRMRG